MKVNWKNGGSPVIKFKEDGHEFFRFHDDGSFHQTSKTKKEQKKAALLI